MDLKGKKVLVIGFGKTGKAATQFLLNRQASVIVTDKKTCWEREDDLDFFKKRGTEFVLGSHPAELFLRPDIIVISPGVDSNLKGLSDAQKQGIPVMSEIELASRFITVPIIAVTGTNGKTTTTSLIAEILQHSGFSVFMGGNIGTPLINVVQDAVQADFIVVELSSFQLETIKEFTPHIAILLNLSEDHLDRHSSFNSYCKIKFRIFINQSREDFAIVNRTDEACTPMIPGLTPQVVSFGSPSFSGKGVYFDPQFLYYRQEDDSTHAYELAKVKLLGEHNKENMAAAVAAAELCGCPQGKIQESLELFRGLEHRLEYVQKIEEVSFYNDSKATNIDSLVKALQSFPGNILLIAGGREKGGDYEDLKKEIETKVKMIILLGEAREKFFRLFHSLTSTRLVEGMEQAVQVAFQNAQGGDVVLLSPGCASFDMFSNYEERGKIYKEAIVKLAETHQTKEGMKL